MGPHVYDDTRISGKNGIISYIRPMMWFIAANLSLQDQGMKRYDVLVATGQSIAPGTGSFLVLGAFAPPC